jgi:hypothetical protein
MTNSRIASLNWRTPIRFIMRARCTSTVRTLSPSSNAICLFTRPAAEPSRTYRSRLVSEETRRFAAAA